MSADVDHGQHIYLTRLDTENDFEGKFVNERDSPISPDASKPKWLVRDVIERVIEVGFKPVSQTRALLIVILAYVEGIDVRTRVKQK